MKLTCVLRIFVEAGHIYEKKKTDEVLKEFSQLYDHSLKS